jgi:hypothetical protein
MHWVAGADNTRRAPEGMWGDGDSALFVDGVHCGRGGKPGLHGTLEEQTDDVPVAAGDLFADDHVQLRSAGRILCGAKGAFDGVVVSYRDDVEAGAASCVLDQL